MIRQIDYLQKNHNWKDQSALEAALGEKLPEGAVIQTARQYLFRGDAIGQFLVFQPHQIKYAGPQ